MKQVKIGQMTTSAWSLGTMTFGTQTDESDAHEQLDMALDAGVTLWDCAELYPVNPIKAETCGRSEEILGNWLTKTCKREQVQIATKVVGPNGGTVRDGHGFDGQVIGQAVDASLKRLQTDYIDLYQLHWPVRGSYHFRQNWRFDPSEQDARADVLEHMEDVLDALNKQVKAGKIREVGLSNESAWGATKWCDLAQADRPRMTAIQNEYSLLCRLYDTDLAEAATHEGLVLLAYSVLATGLLTGKYQQSAVPEGSRMSIGPELGGRKTERAFAAVDAYLALAERDGLDPVHMAIAFTTQRPFPVVPIVGATTAAQLRRILDGMDVVLSEDTLREIDRIHRQHPLPY